MDQGPEDLKNILGRLIIARGWGRKQSHMHLHQAWAAAVGEEHERQTRVVRFRRGVLEVEVANSALLQELANFHKRKLLQDLRKRLPNTMINDIRFKAGSWRQD